MPARPAHDRVVGEISYGHLPHGTRQEGCLLAGGLPTTLAETEPLLTFVQPVVEAAESTPARRLSNHAAVTHRP
jgi:hypothetical protein